jgi:hypothetical protein
VGLMPIGPRDTLLLRACLLGGEATAVAWSGWRGVTPDPSAEIAGRPELKVLLPLLHDGLRAAGVDALELATYLRTARVRERHRAQAIAEVAGTVAAALAGADVAATLTGGLALATTAYADPGLRHCHDIDLVVDPADGARALRALASAGFQCSDPVAGVTTAPRRAVAPGGLPVIVHHGTVSAAITAPEELLARLLGRPGPDGGRELLRFTDAVVLLRASGTRLRWNRVADRLASPAASVQALKILAAVDAIDTGLAPRRVAQARLLAAGYRRRRLVSR